MAYVYISDVTAQSRKLTNTSQAKFYRNPWASLIAQLIKNLPAMQETLVQFLGQEDLLEKGQATHSSILGLPCGSAGKECSCNVEDLGLIPGLGRSPGEGKVYTLQYPGLENSMVCIVHGVAESDTTEQLSLTFKLHPLLSSPSFPCDT